MTCTSARHVVMTPDDVLLREAELGIRYGHSLTATYLHLKALGHPVGERRFSRLWREAGGTTRSRTSS